MIWWVSVFIGIGAVLTIPSLRRSVITFYVYKNAQRSAKKISTFELQALEAGTEGFDKEFFKVNPDWSKLFGAPGVVLSSEEKSFLSGPATELCGRIDDWRIRGVDRNIPDDIWEFIRKNKFIGMRVSKEQGGLGFSAQAQSIILGMIASRSFDVSIIVEVSNSLGPDELIEQYGTGYQRERYLKAFRDGSEVPCFAITSLAGGSDVGSMQDVGIVGWGEHEGKRVLGLYLTWSKRYITLAPKATVIALACRVYDPERLMSSTEARGITLMLIPSSHPGVHIGRRHLPSGSAFPNGPTSGDRVFIPLDWIIGGPEHIGNGWKMIMQCLAAGRGVSLPSMSAAGIQMLLRTTTAYARIRRQFGKPVGFMEGVQEVIVRLVEHAYIGEALRAVTSSFVSASERPLVLASITKYKLTEYARLAVNDALDVHGGKGIVDGPKNYLQSAYQIAPIGITVEGTNIITRSLIVVGQALLRSHPYFAQELAALLNPNSEGLRQFDALFVRHALALIWGGVSAGFHGFTAGKLIVPKRAPERVRSQIKQITLRVRQYAFIADVVILLYQGNLKKRQRIAGRITDALAELYIASSTVKRYVDDGALTDDHQLMSYCVENSLHRFDTSIANLISNIHLTLPRWCLMLLIRPQRAFSRTKRDGLEHEIVGHVLEPGAHRDRLTRHIYLPVEASEPVALLDSAMTDAVANNEIIEQFEKFDRTYDRPYLPLVDRVAHAVRSAVLSERDGLTLMQYYAKLDTLLAVDDFEYPENLKQKK